MKPNWENAPKRAKYLARNADGEWRFWEKMPGVSEHEWENPFSDSWHAGFEKPEWHSYIEKRP